jgi:ligand-binding sensor domain-containing protein
LLCSVSAEQLPTTLFSARDGLATTVTRIIADSRGFLWFPGSEGLVRFDGNSFRTFDARHGLPGIAADIVERVDGTYWVAASEQLCLFDPRTDRKRFQCESPGIGTIQTLVENERGLWCGTDKGLWRRAKASGASWEFMQAVASGPSIAVTRLLKDSRGDVWVATHSGLCRFGRDGRTQRWTHAEGLRDVTFDSVVETPGAIWAGTQVELLRFRVDPQTGDARLTDRYDRSHGLPSSYVSAVHFWEGQVWAATAQGLARQLPSGRWQGVEFDPSLNRISTKDLATDSLGNLWLGTDAAAVARISSSGFRTFTEREGLGLRKVWAVFEDREGHLVALTKDEDGYFLNWFDGNRFHAKRPKTPFPMFNWSWSQIAVHSRAGEWWLATGSGLLQYPKRLEAVPSQVGPDMGFHGRNTIRVFEDSQGRIWTATSGTLVSRATIGLYRRDPKTGRFESFDESNGLPDRNLRGNRPSAFVEDRQGQVWIGTLNSGLLRYRSGRFERLQSAGAPDQGVRSLLVDGRGRLWIGARRRGLLRVDDTSAANPVFNAYTKSSGLSSVSIDALAEDLAGRIYAASEGIIDRLDPDTGRIRAFTTADGVLSGTMWAAFRDGTGALWFGGDQGLCTIQPRADRTDPPAVLIHGI